MCDVSTEPSWNYLPQNFLPPWVPGYRWPHEKLVDVTVLVMFMLWGWCWYQVLLTLPLICWLPWLSEGHCLGPQLLLQWLQVLGHVLVSLHGKGTSFSSRAIQYLDWNCCGHREIVLVKSSCPDGYQFPLALDHTHISFPITTATNTEGPQAQHKMQRKQPGMHTAAHSLSHLLNASFHITPRVLLLWSTPAWYGPYTYERLLVYLMQ